MTFSLLKFLVRYDVDRLTFRSSSSLALFYRMPPDFGTLNPMESPTSQLSLAGLVSSAYFRQGKFSPLRHDPPYYRMLTPHCESAT